MPHTKSFTQERVVKELIKHLETAPMLSVETEQGYLVRWKHLLEAIEIFTQSKNINIKEI
jgi:hypothetical protein